MTDDTLDQCQRIRPKGLALPAVDASLESPSRVRTLSERGLDSVGGLVLGDEAHNPIVDLIRDVAS
jgi:hypothetical protein